MDNLNNDELFNDEEYPIFDLWGESCSPGPVDDLLARIITDDEEDYEDEFFDPDEFE